MYAGVPLEDDVVVCSRVPEEGTVSVSVGVPGGALGWRGVCCVNEGVHVYVGMCISC